MNFRSILMTIAVATIACTSAGAADKPLGKDFLAFWPGFKAALQKNDKAAIASMTKLPYLREDGKKLDRAAFINEAEKVFPASARKCLLKGKPIADQGSEVFVFCGDDIYVFAKDNGQYKFSEIGVND